MEKKSDHPLNTPSFLPTAAEGSAAAAANDAVLKEMSKAPGSQNRGKYHQHSDDLRARMGHRVAEYGNSQLSADSPKRLVIRSVKVRFAIVKQLYLAKLKDPSRVTALPHGNEGHPILPDSLDEEVADYIRALHKAGGCVSTSIVIVAARGIVAHKKPSLLKENGGHISFTKDWADSFRRHHHFVK